MRETCLDVFLAIFSLLEGLILLSLAKLENVTSHRIARGKITVLDRKSHLKEPLKARFNA